MLNMGVFKQFLENSTVHGLSYISSSKSISRFLWTLVVVSGFSFACVLIYQSYQSWESSPVSTTIETRPISEIKFPKITVCPPKNTFTNLNFDLNVGNITLRYLDIVHFFTCIFYNILVGNKGMIYYQLLWNSYMSLSLSLP